ncbi:MAG: D-alanyl-D-alanine carboxypeptidase family protein [Thermoleophilaceae bacterium]
MTPARGTIAALCVSALATVAGAAPAAAAPPRLPRAAAAIVVDAREGAVLFRKDPDERRAIASTTKLMTALLALERTKPDEVFTAPAYHALAAESKIDLRAGERMRVHDLLRALLLESANDAAATIAEGVAGSRSAFVDEMNRRAAELHLDETHYANPVGLDQRGNYSTARDLARLATRLMRDGRFARIVNLPEAVLRSGARRRVVDNRNDLVARHPFVDGIKTGHTVDAGYVLVGAGHAAGGPRVISVVLGEPSEAARDEDTLTLLRFGLSRFRPLRALERDRSVARVKIEHRGGRAELVPARSVTLAVRRGQRLGRRVLAPGELDGPLPAGRRVGRVVLLLDGRPVRTVPLVTARRVPGAGPARVALSLLGLPLTLLLLLGILVTAALAVLRMRVRLRVVRERRPTKAP